MTSKKYLLFTTIILLSLFISACSSAIYASTGWHGISPNTETVYLAAGNQVYAVDIKTGSELWRYPSKPNSKISFYANPVLVSESQLLVPSYDTNLYSLNPATGSENWIFEGSSHRLIASPLVYQDMIYQPSTDHSIYALDLTGKQVWTQETGGPIWAQPASLPNCGCIYVASMDHFVYSLDAANGNILWKSPDLGGALVSTPAVGADGIIYVGTFNKEMLGLNATDGTIKWRFATEDWVWSGAALSNDVLYFGDLSGYFYALNASDGTSLWRIQPQNAIVSPPAILEDRIYLTTEGDSLFIINTAGNIESRKTIGGFIYSSPVIIGDTVLVSPTGFDSLLIAANLDGNPKWAFTPAKK